MERKIKQEPLLKIKDIAAAVGVTIPTVYQWIRSNELRAIDLNFNSGRRPVWRIVPEDLEAFLDTRTNQNFGRKS